jgi:hypothetical protein
MMVYFFLSPILYDAYVTRGAESVSNDGLPQATNKGKAYIDGLDLLSNSEGNLFRLWGWAFLTLDKQASPEDYVRKIILVSDDRVYTFPTIAVPRSGVQEVYKDLGMDLLNSGFYTDISKEAIAPGIYKIHISFTHPDGTSYLLNSGRVIERTINLIELR